MSEKKYDNPNKVFSIIEPKVSCRFILEAEGLNIPEWCYRKYKLYNDGDKLIFTTEILETIQTIINPKDLFNITSFCVKTLDPKGHIIHKLSFDISDINFHQKNEYKKSKISKFKIKGTVKLDSIFCTYVEPEPTEYKL